MPDISANTMLVPVNLATDMARATFFVLEALTYIDDHTVRATLEEAEAEGGYMLHIGLPDRPATRRAEVFDTFAEGVDRLADLRLSHPYAGLWLATLEQEVQIEGDDVWEGVVFARADIDPSDEDCEWVRLSRIITRADADGVRLRGPLKEWLDGHDVSDVVGDIIDRL